MVPCSGRVEELLMLKAFENGADGVMVVGCLEGDCHYMVGNLRARRRVERVAGRSGKARREARLHRQSQESRYHQSRRCRDREGCTCR